MGPSNNCLNTPCTGLLQGSKHYQIDAHALQRQSRPCPQKDVVYQWCCSKPNCKSSYIGEMSRSLSEHVKEHGKKGNSAIYQHCSNKGHPLPKLDHFKVTDQEKSQIACEAIHIQILDPELNRNVGKNSYSLCI